MEQIDNMHIIKKNNRLELVISETALFEEYEDILNYLMSKMNLKDIKEIDDFDSRYQFFDYNSQVIILYYSNFLGISIYFDDKTINMDEQKGVLNVFLEVLKTRH